MGNFKMYKEGIKYNFICKYKEMKGLEMWS